MCGPFAWSPGKIGEKWTLKESYICKMGFTSSRESDVTCFINYHVYVFTHVKVVIETYLYS